MILIILGILKENTEHKAINNITRLVALARLPIKSVAQLIMELS